MTLPFDQRPRPTDPARLALMPNLFVIGASKSGSSALHAYLRLHPEIRMSDEKEPCFFVDPEELLQAWPIMARRACSHDWNAYLDLWTGGEGARYRGEGSVYYSQAPHRSGVAARIAQECPQARILYIVRDPVSRSIGHYWQRQKEFQEPLPLHRAIRENPIYRDTSDYTMQLKEYLAVFPKEQIKVVVAERLRDRRRETIDEIVAWLGLNSFNPTAEQLVERHKSPATSRRERFPGVRAIRDSALWARLRGLLPSGMVAALRSAGTTKFDKAEVDDAAVRSLLIAEFAPKVREFRELVNDPVPEWKL